MSSGDYFGDESNYAYTLYMPELTEKSFYGHGERNVYGAVHCDVAERVKEEEHVVDERGAVQVKGVGADGVH
jgi:hypothetical protein